MGEPDHKRLGYGSLGYTSRSPSPPIELPPLPPLGRSSRSRSRSPEPQGTENQEGHGLSATTGYRGGGYPNITPIALDTGGTDFDVLPWSHQVDGIETLRDLLKFIGDRGTSEVGKLEKIPDRISNSDKVGKMASGVATAIGYTGKNQNREDYNRAVQQVLTKIPVKGKPGFPTPEQPLEDFLRFAARVIKDWYNFTLLRGSFDAPQTYDSIDDMFNLFTELKKKDPNVKTQLNPSKGKLSPEIQAVVAVPKLSPMLWVLAILQSKGEREYMRKLWYTLFYEMLSHDRLEMIDPKVAAELDGILPPAEDGGGSSLP